MATPRHPLHDLGIQVDPTAPAPRPALYAATLTPKTVYRRAFTGTSKPYTHAWGVYYDGELMRWGFSSSLRNAKARACHVRSRLSWRRELCFFDIQIVDAVEVQ